VAEIGKLIGTREIAAKRGCHPSTAWRLLRKLRNQGGDAVVAQDGPGLRLRTSLAALRAADSHQVEVRTLEREDLKAEVLKHFRVRNAALEKANVDLRDEINSLKLQVSSLREALSYLTTALQSVARRSASDSKV
jgi:hypothetical protein